MGGRYVTTDNAYVHQPMISISADVSCRITAVEVTENQPMTAGKEIFRIDDEPIASPWCNRRQPWPRPG